LVETRQTEIAMNKPVSFSTLVLSLLLLNPAKAGQPGPDWMPAQQVIEQALKSGYTQVSELEADDGRWEGEGIKNGKKMEFHADPRTGVITFEKLDDK
jgi:Peptidase propeptide and YPEB domain